MIPLKVQCPLPIYRTRAVSAEGTIEARKIRKLLRPFVGTFALACSNSWEGSMLWRTFCINGQDSKLWYFTFRRWMSLHHQITISVWLDGQIICLLIYLQKWKIAQFFTKVPRFKILPNTLYNLKNCKRQKYLVFYSSTMDTLKTWGFDVATLKLILVSPERKFHAFSYVSLTEAPIFARIIIR